MKRFITVIIIAWIGIMTFGQDTPNERPPLSERLFIGGSFGLQFGTITNIEASPVIGLWVLPRVAVAAGPSYQYYKDPVDGTSIYGGKAYLQVTLIQDLNNIIPIGINTGIFVQSEYQALSLERSFWSLIPEGNKRIYMGTFLAGAGISQPMGRRSSMNFTVLWALTDTEYLVYDTPEIRVSFNF